MIVFGYDLAKAPWLMIAYILASIVGLVYGTTYVNSINSVRAVIFALGTLLVLVYFGFKWFGSRVPALKNWPPVINMCPDYLTYVKVPSATINGKTVTSGCIDMLGVTTSTSATALQMSTASAAKAFKTGTQAPSSLNMCEFTSADVKAATKPSELKNICARCQELGITWEGVYDGDTCVGVSASANKQAEVEKCLLSV